MMSESYFRPNAIGNVIPSTRTTTSSSTARQIVRRSRHDGLQPVPIHPKLKAVFTDYAKKNSDTVRAKGAKPVFFMSWAYADKPEMTAQLAEAYTVAGNANNAAGYPGGPCFRARLQQAARTQSLRARQAPSVARRNLSGDPAWCLRR